MSFQCASIRLARPWGLLLATALLCLGSVAAAEPAATRPATQPAQGTDPTSTEAAVKADESAKANKGLKAKPNEPEVTDEQNGEAEEKPSEPVAGGKEEALKLKDRGGVGPVWEMLAYTLILLALAGAGIYVAKRFLPRLGVQSSRRIGVEETVHLAPKQAVHLLRVGARTYLVSNARENISLLADVTQAMEEAPEGGGEGPSGSGASAAGPAKGGSFLDRLRERIIGPREDKTT